MLQEVEFQNWVSNVLQVTDEGLSSPAPTLCSLYTRQIWFQRALTEKENDRIARCCEIWVTWIAAYNGILLK